MCSSNITASGNLYYDEAGAKSKAWGHWTVHFKDMKPADGTGVVCIDSGGWGKEGGSWDAENIFWIVYGH